MMISVAKTKDYVLNIFKNNRNIFDQLKLVSEDHHKDIMDSFTTSKKSFEEAK
jgi:DNA-binding transcriptional regulator WhiA